MERNNIRESKEFAKTTYVGNDLENAPAGELLKYLYRQDESSIAKATGIYCIKTNSDQFPILQLNSGDLLKSQEITVNDVFETVPKKIILG